MLISLSLVSPIHRHVVLLGIFEPKACRALSLSGSATCLNCFDLQFDPCLRADQS